MLLWKIYILLFNVWYNIHTFVMIINNDILLKHSDFRTTYIVNIT